MFIRTMTLKINPNLKEKNNWLIVTPQKIIKPNEDYFRKGPLRHEIDLYEFAKSIFYKKRKHLLGH